MPKTKTHYVKQAELREAIIKSKEQDQLTPEAIDMLMKMCNKIANMNVYQLKEDRDDCIAYAMEDCLRYWRSYNPEYSSFCFSYFTRMIINGMKKGWKKLHPLKSINLLSLSNEKVFNI